MARHGDYEGALKNAVNVKDLIERRIKTEEDKVLWDIFMREFEDISSTLNANMEKERKEGLKGSVDRTSNRSDYTAKKLYNYSSANQAGCVVQ